MSLNQLHEKLTIQNTLFKEHVEEDKSQNQRHLDILEKVSEQVSNTQRCLDKLNNKVDLSSQRLQSEIEKINKLDEIQNEQLAIHIKGVQTNTQKLELQKEQFSLEKKVLAARILELEKPREWFKMTKKVVLGSGALAAAIYAVLKLFEVF